MDGTTPAPSVSTAAQKALSDVALAALKIYLPIVGTAVQNIQNTSDNQQVVAQALQAESAILTSFPELEQAEIKVLAADTNAFIQQLGPYLLQQAAGIAPAPTPAPIPAPAAAPPT